MRFTDSLFSWVRRNRLAALVILVLFVLLVFAGFPSLLVNLPSSEQYVTGGWSDVGKTGGLEDVASSLVSDTMVPTSDSTSEERMTIQESNLSLVVSDVPGTADTIVSYAESVGGFMVSSSVSRAGESPTATVVVRVPSDRLREAVGHLRTLAVKVSSENLQGTDVTEAYADIEARIATLEATIARFEEIRARATEISDLVTVTNKIISLQEQIDTYKGQKKYLEDSAAYSRITVYLATDELALPYQPSTAFRPSVVFRQALRSLLANLYAFGRLAIWVGVYAVFWGPVLAIILIKRRRRRRGSS